MAEEEIERSESGAPIHRHKARETGWEPPQVHAAHCEEIEAHLEKHVGKVTSVYHEIVSDLVHLDVLFLAPSEERPYNLLVTSGVSDLPMKVPEGREDFQRAELLIALPKDWPMSEAAFEDEANYWPLRFLKFVGRMPHEYLTWIGEGHTIQNGSDNERIANTGFTAIMLTVPWEYGPEFFQLSAQDGSKITFYLMVPIYPEEMELKLKKGAAELEGRFEKQKLKFVLDTNRPNAALKRGWFKW